MDPSLSFVTWMDIDTFYSESEEEPPVLDESELVELDESELVELDEPVELEELDEGVPLLGPVYPSLYQPPPLRIKLVLDTAFSTGPPSHLGHAWGGVALND